MSSEKIMSISLNPFFCSKLLHHFISGYNKDAELPLIYLVLPYLLYQPSRNVLASANSRSSIHSLFTDNDKNINIAGIEERYHTYKQLTNQSLIVACNENLINLSGRNIILSRYVNYQKETDTLLKQYYRA
ncbi:three component ABC system middle component, partial [Bacillus cereus]